jgi:transcriptional regulator with XRE-family HTH domain
MRPSKLRHPLAVLRQIIGLGQKEMAELIECSVATIQSVELKRMTLSEELAQRIADATSVDISCLMAGDPKAMLLDDFGFPYELNAFEGAQQRQRMDSAWQSLLGNITIEETRKEAAPYAKRLAALILKATHRGRHGLVMWQIEHAVAELEKRYAGPNPSVAIHARKKRK